MLGQEKRGKEGLPSRHKATVEIDRLEPKWLRNDGGYDDDDADDAQEE